jgi:hypothetical protein
MNKYIKKFQEGGEMPAAPQAQNDAAAQQAGADQQMQQMQAMIGEILSSGNCDMALQFVQMIAEQMGMASAPQQPAPVFKKGGKMMKKTYMKGGKAAGKFSKNFDKMMK